MVGREGFEPSTIGLKVHKGNFKPFYSTTYRGARCNLCTTMYNDAQLIPAKSPQDYLAVINPASDKSLQ